MQVFHYLSHVLRNMRNFECGAGRVNSEDGEGAVYNDFDFDTTSLVVEAGNLCSQTSVHTNDTPTTSMAPQDAVEFAILEADKSEGVLYEHTVFDHPLFDCETAVVDEEYIQKVYDIVCKRRHKISKIWERVCKMSNILTFYI